MRFTPKTERQLQEEMLVAAGDYDFTVIAAEEKQSKAGNDMIALQLVLFTNEGERRVRDWLVSGSPLGESKVRQFCYAVGVGALYESGGLVAEDCLQRSGKCKVVQKAANGQYGPSNSVADYLTFDAKPEVKVLAKSSPDVTQGDVNKTLPNIGPQRRPAMQTAPTGNHQPVGEEDIPF